ncbi:hypothetical protein JRO89_XS08G0219500 [Xanthoceras sorbifolium]|uniref:Rhodopsin n=1 Tax=Xanthoceras sorbifolium TaxID=99658 RepID=A0ABQ8HQX6_9ROSI|nr:hypothetical protein JRO89_XS08G0219500 [Xanthoceras sorbifolium]
MSYYNQQQPPVGVPPPQGYPPKDAYPPPGYPVEGYAQGYPPQSYPPQGYAPQYAQPPPRQETGFLEGWPFNDLHSLNFSGALLLLPSGCLLLRETLYSMAIGTSHVVFL